MVDEQLAQLQLRAELVAKFGRGVGGRWVKPGRGIPRKGALAQSNQ